MLPHNGPGPEQNPDTAAGQQMGLALFAAPVPPPPPSLCCCGLSPITDSAHQAATLPVGPLTLLHSDVSNTRGAFPLSRNTSRPQTSVKKGSCAFCFSFSAFFRMDKTRTIMLPSYCCLWPLLYLFFFFFAFYVVDVLKFQNRNLEKKESGRTAV